MSYATSRQYPGAPTGAHTLASDRWAVGAYAAPFALTDSLEISTLSAVVMGHNEIKTTIVMAIFAMGATARPTGAALAIASARPRNTGPAIGVLTAPVSLTAGSYFAVTSISGQKAMLAAVGGDLAFSAFIGTANIVTPGSGLFLPPPTNLDADPFTGSEAWQDVVGPAGAPLVWLGA